MNELDKSSQFLFYNGNDGKIQVQIIVGQETVWATQSSMAEIFGIDRSGITKHIQNIYDTNELDYQSTCAKIAQVQNEGGRSVNRPVDFFNLDVIIAVGYRVNSYHATQFRIWATRILREYLIKGFALDDERLKQGNQLFGKDYFKELLERIRDIRASEMMFYEKVKELYKTSVDYDKDAPETKNIFAKIQNKLEYAITHNTSAEIIKKRVNSSKPNMGLTTWKNARKEGEIQKSDVTVAKNYLTEEELKALNLIVTMFLDYAELQVSKNRLMKMRDWNDKLDLFLKFNEYDVLTHNGKIRKDVADKFAETEYAKYKVVHNKKTDDFNNIAKQIKESGAIPKQIQEKKVTLSEFNKKLITAIENKPKKNQE